MSLPLLAVLVLISGIPVEDFLAGDHPEIADPVIVWGLRAMFAVLLVEVVAVLFGAFPIGMGPANNRNPAEWDVGG